jgi:hypothetical protein
LGDQEKGSQTAMKKTMDLIVEAIRHPKHPFRQVDSQPNKAHKHRYERRKIKEYMRQGDWSEEAFQ